MIHVAYAVARAWPISDGISTSSRQNCRSSRRKRAGLIRFSIKRSPVGGSPSRSPITGPLIGGMNADRASTTSLPARDSVGDEGERDEVEQIGRASLGKECR